MKSMTSPGHSFPIETESPPKKKLQRTVIDSFYKSSFVSKAPEYTFGTGARPSILQVEGGPGNYSLILIFEVLTSSMILGPGAYPIKTTLGKLMESHIESPGYFSLRGRTKFGDPYEKATSKATKNLPGSYTYFNVIFV